MGSAQKVTQFHSHLHKPVDFHGVSWVSKTQKHSPSKSSLARQERGLLPEEFFKNDLAAVGCITEVPWNRQCCDWKCFLKELVGAE